MIAGPIAQRYWDKVEEERQAAQAALDAELAAKRVSVATVFFVCPPRRTSEPRGVFLSSLSHSGGSALGSSFLIITWAITRLLSLPFCAPAVANFETPMGLDSFVCSVPPFRSPNPRLPHHTWER